MPKPGDLVIVTIIDQQEIGDSFARKRLAWPLHITLARWFTPGDPAACSELLRVVADSASPFEVTVGGEADFGPEGATKVSLIEMSGSLMALHGQLLSAVRRSGGVFEAEQWIGAEYRPHVTHHGERRQQQGDILHISDFHLVQVDSEDTCTIIEKFVLAADPAKEEEG